MSNLLRAIIARPAAVRAAAGALLLAGIVAAMRLPLTTRTAVELPRLTISAAWPGASPEALEAQVTSPIEAAVQGVRGVKRVTSNSFDDFALLLVELAPGADVPLSRLAIIERLALLRREWPPGVLPPTVANHVPQGLEEPPLLSLTLSGPLTPGALQQLLERQVNPRLAAVAGVAGVSVRGGAERGVSITYGDGALREAGVTPTAVSAALSGARLVQSLGVEHDRATPSASRTDRFVVLRDEPRAIDDLAALPVIGALRRNVPLGTLASIRADEDARGRFHRVNGVPAVSVDVTRHAGADAMATARAVRVAMAQLQPLLPPGVSLRVTSDESVQLADELHDVVRRGGLAALAVVLILILWLRRWRAVVLVTASTVVALAATGLTLYVLRIPVNLLTLAGLSMGIGILVQDALIVVHVLGVRRRHGQATARAAPAVIGSTLTTAVVLLPFLYLQGDARRAFTPFAAALAIALAWSLVTSLVMLPALGDGMTDALPQWRRVSRWYVHLLARLLRWRRTALASFSLLMVGMVVLFAAHAPRATALAGDSRRTTLTVTLGFPRGSDPASIDRAMRAFEAVVVGHPAVALVRTLSSGGARAEMKVLFTPGGARTDAPIAMQEQLTARAMLVGGAEVSVVGDGPGFASGSGGNGLSTFRLRVRGYSYDGVARIANDLRQRLERMPRAREVRITSGALGGNDHAEEITLTPDRAALARFGITAQQLTQVISREVRGPVGRQLVTIGGEELPVRVKAAGSHDRDVAELRRAPVLTPSGFSVPVGSVATVASREAMGTIVREDQQYMRLVLYEVRGNGVLARRIHDAFVRSLSAPAGYRITDLTDGDPDIRDDSAGGLWLVFAVGVALVLLAVSLVFDSLRAAFWVFTSIPLALGGVGGAFLLARAPAGREAAVGVILVVGIAVHQVIVVVDAFLRRREGRGGGVDVDAHSRGTGPSAPAQVLRAAAERSGLVMAMTGTSLASVMPLAFGTPANSLFGTIATATAGGTVAGTLSALFVVPLLMAGRRTLGGPSGARRRRRRYRG